MLRPKKGIGGEVWGSYDTGRAPRAEQPHIRRSSSLETVTGLLRVSADSLNIQSLIYQAGQNVELAGFEFYIWPPLFEKCGAVSSVVYSSPWVPPNPPQMSMTLDNFVSIFN